jgi:alpha-tubulin suppressor-like RCC1 family protein
MSGGFDHFLLINEFGRGFSMGNNQVGQLGIKGSVSQSTEVPVPMSLYMNSGYLNSKLTKVSAGAFHSIALSVDNKVYVWGAFYVGSARYGPGTGSTTYETIPVPVPASSYNNLVPIDVSNGAAGAIILTSDGSVWVTCSNAFGQQNPGTSGSTPTQAFVSANTAIQNALYSNEIITEVYGQNSSFIVRTNQSRIIGWGAGYFGVGATSVSGTPIVFSTSVTGAVVLNIPNRNITMFTPNRFGAHMLVATSGCYSPTVINTTISPVACSSALAAYGFGYNTNYNIGDNTNTVKVVPTAQVVTNMAGYSIIDMSLGGDFGAVLTSSGNVFAVSYSLF